MGSKPGVKQAFCFEKNLCDVEPLSADLCKTNTGDIAALKNKGLNTGRGGKEKKEREKKSKQPEQNSILPTYSDTTSSST